MHCSDRWVLFQKLRSLNWWWQLAVYVRAAVRGHRVGCTPMKTKGSWHPQAPGAQGPGGRPSEERATWGRQAHRQGSGQPLEPTPAPRMTPAPGRLQPLRLRTGGSTTCHRLSFPPTQRLREWRGKRAALPHPWCTAAPRPLGKEHKVSVQVSNYQKFNFQHHVTLFTK